jgi:two-component system chemotaxis response regulator CheY
MTKTVLVVDDSSTIRSEVSIALKEAGFDVIAAVDGIDALAQLKAATAVVAVIADINMPRMDGLEMLERIKADPKYAALPVVMLTTEGQPDLVQRAKAAGAKGWLVKPFRRDLLLSVVKKVTGG